MTRYLKKIICLILGLAAAIDAHGFSMWGPAESWQVQALDYGTRFLPFFPPPDLLVQTVEGDDFVGSIIPELGGTKGIGAGSRLNTPIITYGFDSTFLNFFGAQGVTAVDSAFAVLNGLPSASTANLSQFVTQGNQQINYSAQAMRMMDLKSVVLWLMIEHMGMIGETHTYDLRERVPVLGGAGSCDFQYVVLQRNYDPITYNPSQYVNGTLLTYQIGELCPTPGVGDAMEESAQAGAVQFSSVATRETLTVGGYYLRITRDDMGGLKYLYRKSRYVNEGVDANVTAGSANQGSFSAAVNAIGTVGTTAPGTFSGLMGGVEKITFVKVGFDSVLGTGFTPITYRYTVPVVTNNVLLHVTMTRTITAPDIVFTAGDLTFPGPDPGQLLLQRSSGFITYGDAATPGSVNGNAVTTVPSVFTPEEVVTFNNTGQVFYNETGAFEDQNSQINVGFLWGSFNGSTNAPIVFPTGTSINSIESQVLSAGPATTLPSPFIALTALTNISQVTQ